MRSNMQTTRLAFICLAFVSAGCAYQPPQFSSTDSRPLLSRRDEISCKAVDSRLPDTFKCPDGTNCLSLDNGSSSLCCPEGNACSNIATIPCDVQQQNVTRNPSSSILTTRLGDKLPTCGDTCCPFGYTCIEAPRNQPNSSPVCSLLTSSSKSGTSDTSPASPSSSRNASSSATQSSSSSRTAASSSSAPTSTTSSGASTNSAEVEQKCNKFPATVFLAGLFPGMFVGAFMMLAWVICSGRHRKPPQRTSATSSVYKPHISDPIPMHAGGMRADFLRRTTGRARSMFSNFSGQSPTISTRENWKMPTPPVVNNIPTAPLGVPVTPERRVPRDSVTESIKIFSPPSASTYQNATPTYPPNIAPLRGMNAQRYMDQGSNSNAPMGSPFETPPNARSAANRTYSTTAHERTNSSYSAVSSIHEHEVLTPARYDGGDYEASRRPRSVSAGEKTRPNTTFTEMLHEAGFPDFYSNAPEVPKIPKGYARR